MRINHSSFLYIGPIRSKTLGLLCEIAAERAEFVTPTKSEKQWLTVKEAIPQAKQQVIKLAAESGDLTYYEFNLADFNASQPATGLYTLYPGLQLLESRQQSLTGIDALLDDIEIQTLDTLVIEQPELVWPMLQRLAKNEGYQHIRQLYLRVGAIPLYQDMPESATILEWCEQNGFELQAEYDDDPDLPLLQLSRHAYYDHWLQATRQNAELNQQLKGLQQKLEKAQEQAKAQQQETDKQLKEKADQLVTQQAQVKQQVEEGAEKIKTLQAELSSKAEQVISLEETLKATEAEREKYNGYFAARKKQHEEAKAQLADAQHALKERDTTISQLSEQLAALQQSNERFSQLEGKLEALFGEQKTYIQQTTNVLGQHVTRSAREQRDEQALTHYLQHGQRPVSTQLPPGYAMKLLEHYETTQHDVVVVLGSSETTELLAQAILNTREQQPRLSGGQREKPDSEVTLSHADLPQAVVSIEHQKAASETLKQRLANKGLAQAVSVVYAPWVECQANGQSALFYAADATLKRLNQWLPDDAQVLIIVGEALPDAGHSREVALPVLLQQLPTQRLDIVLEGSNQAQEASLQENWNKLLESRQRPGQWQLIHNFCLLKI
ncbi:hypothetical protein LL947_03445 [Halomonas sp. BLK-85]